MSVPPQLTPQQIQEIKATALRFARSATAGTASQPQGTGSTANSKRPARYYSRNLMQYYDDAVSDWRSVGELPSDEQEPTTRDFCSAESGGWTQVTAGDIARFSINLEVLKFRKIDPEWGNPEGKLAVLDANSARWLKHKVSDGGMPHDFSLMDTGTIVIHPNDVAILGRHARRAGTLKKRRIAGVPALLVDLDPSENRDQVKKKLSRLTGRQVRVRHAAGAQAAEAEVKTPAPGKNKNKARGEAPQKTRPLDDVLFDPRDKDLQDLRAKFMIFAQEKKLLEDVHFVLAAHAYEAAPTRRDAQLLINTFILGSTPRDMDFRRKHLDGVSDKFVDPPGRNQQANVLGFKDGILKRWEDSNGSPDKDLFGRAYDSVIQDIEDKYGLEFEAWCRSKYRG